MFEILLKVIIFTILNHFYVQFVLNIEKDSGYVKLYTIVHTIMMLILPFMVVIAIILW